jgi:hypothetical protein
MEFFTVEPVMKYVAQPVIYQFFKYILVTLFISLTAFAQTETLTNNDIVELTKAGLATDVIMKKIGTANTAFDISTSGLVELKRASVDDGVIATMIERQQVFPSNRQIDNTPAYSESGSKPNSFVTPIEVSTNKKDILATARTIAFVKSSLQPSRQALEKELMKRPDFQQLHLTIERYKDAADLYVEIGYVSMSWITHRYVYRVYDRRSGAVVAAGETTSWGSLAENLARHIANSLSIAARS